MKYQKHNNRASGQSQILMYEDLTALNISSIANVQNALGRTTQGDCFMLEISGRGR